MDFFIYKNNRLPAVLAITEEEQTKGLMHQLELPPVMAFVYTEPRYSSFWMRSVPKPLDIIFCLKNKIVSIAHGIPYCTDLIGGRELSDLVLEIPRGRAEDFGMKIGDDIKMEYHPKSISRILLRASYKI